MVSPQKKKKLERKKTEQSPAKNSVSKRPKNSAKPLADKKFYLDIHNHSALKRIEAKLIALGASLEFFLVKEVDYVVTDRENYLPGRRASNEPSPSPLLYCSVSSGTTDSPTDGVNHYRARSRAETMLERVRNQPQKTIGDILDNAVAWKIPIYPLQRFISWLEKVGKHVEKLTNDQVLIGRGVRELKGSYLKIETNSRPEFRQFSSWPTLGLISAKSTQGNGNDSQRMTRKVNRTVKEASSAPGGGNGYCEMCRVYYDQLDSHIVSAQHSKLANDSSQYSQLDSLITHHNLGVGALRKSLRIAKSPPPHLSCGMGGRNSVESGQKLLSSSPIPSGKLNGHVTRSASKNTALIPQVNLGSPVAFPLNCNGIELRSRKTPQKPASAPSEDERLKVKKLSSPPPTLIKSSPSSNIIEHNLRSRRCQVVQSDLKSSGSKPMPVLRAIPIVPKKTPSKSSKSVGKSPVPKISPPSPPPPPQSLPPTRRLVKKRLSVEEKFIEDNKSYYKVEVLNSKLRSTDYFISQKQVEQRVNGNNTSNNNNQVKSPDVKSVVVRFKKVRKSELAALSDEAESFMFGEPRRGLEQEETSEEESEETDEESEEETPKSKKKPKRLTSDKTHSSKSSETIKIKEEFLGSLKIKQEDVETEVPEKVQFSFEMKPREEVWMATYKRQATGTEHYIPQHHSYPSYVVLPYEMPRRKFRKSKVGGSRLQQVQAQLMDDKPRKSPRCHASTLAIMSSLISRRRLQRECSDRPVNYEEESSLSETVESSTSASSVTPQFQVGDLVASAITMKDYVTDSLLTAEKKGDIHPLMFIGVDPQSADNAVSFAAKSGFDQTLDSLLSNYKQCVLDLNERHNYKHLNNLRYSAVDSCASSDCSEFFGFRDDGKDTKKKKRKKRNLTGWPNESRHKRRKEASSTTLTDILPSSPVVQSSPFPRKRGRPPKNAYFNRKFHSKMPTLNSQSSASSSPRKGDNSFSKKRKLSRFLPNSSL